MSSEEFTSILDCCMLQLGYQKKGNRHYKRNEEIILVVGKQKSLYGNDYYINYGLYLVPGGELKYPKEVQCDLSARFIIDKDGKTLISIPLDEFTEKDIRNNIIRNAKQVEAVFDSGGIGNYYRSDIRFRLIASPRLKSYVGDN